MRIFSGFARFAGGYRSAHGVLMFLAVLAMSAGCGQKKEQPASAAPVSQTNSVASSQPADSAASQAAVSTAAPVSKPAAAPAPVAGEPDLTDLNRAVRKWMIQNRAVPKNFDDFVAKSGASIPPAPAGKKYILNQNMHVQLVNQ